jgi:hypothetical protein
MAQSLDRLNVRESAAGAFATERIVDTILSELTDLRSMAASVG